MVRRNLLQIFLSGMPMVEASLTPGA